MERRLFIRLSSFTAAALTLPLLEGCDTHSGDGAISTPAILARIVDDKEIKQLGLVYRKQNNGEDDKLRLMALLSGKEGVTKSDHLKQILNERVVTDFKSGSTVHLNGWIISVTEARQCALYSILKG